MFEFLNRRYRPQAEPKPVPRPPSSQAILRALWLEIDRQIAAEMGMPPSDRCMPVIDALYDLRAVILPPRREPVALPNDPANRG